MARKLRSTLADKKKVKRIPPKTPKIKTRSGFEDKAVDLLDKYKIEYGYEEAKLKYIVPAKQHTYLSDFVLTCKETGRKYYIETKGYFRSLSERVKYLLIAEQNPDITLVMCFMKPTLTIGKNSKTTYKEWFDKHGIINIDLKQLDKVLKQYKLTGKLDFNV